MAEAGGGLGLAYTSPIPELPELEVVQEVLNRRIVGQTIAAAEAIAPGAAIVLRDLSGAGFGPALTGARFDAIVRRGKFLVFTLAAADGAPLWLVINPKLTGRLQLCDPQDKKAGPVHVVLHLSGGRDLRYVDQKKMGQVFITRQPPELAPIADFAGLGPDALAVGREEFKARLKKFQGEIKGVLTRGECVAGIGNAYADEVLWWAKLHPYRKRASLTAEEVDRLYDGMRACLLDATEKVRAEMGEDIHLKPRDFLAIHMKAGEPCPRCSTAISLVGANQRITNFCRTCQPGGLIKGM